ncbi:hypothetical protein [Streptomyces sp. NBC_01443]|uniref:hypothetical protein n=1 Tax=Streptomyces sp. NBC_01443 TaxID=2903868 RepID=UPI00224E1773|nr:hypothetical protein [Streptomyces sp. NBC_01443]MCX4631653.1 hypothetical protein [Streptomyces sp. NBC_01443]
MPCSVEHLLAELDPLPYADRLRLVATTARDLAPSGELPGVLADLAGRGRYERRLAALAALAGRQTEYLAQQLADPDPVIRSFAVRAVRTLPVPDEAIEAAYDDASAEIRRDLARAVLWGSRRALAERLVPVLRAEWGDGEAAVLLPACGPEFVSRLLPQLTRAVTQWTRLGRSHPGAVLDQAANELAELPELLRAMWWHRQAPGVAAALPAAPERVLALLEQYGPDRLPRPLEDRIGDLIAVDAERFVRWLTAPERTAGHSEHLLPQSVLRRLVRADPPSLLALGRRWAGRPAYLAALVKALPPGRREAFHDAATAHTPAPDGLVPDPVLAVLPRGRRQAEARRRAERARRDGWALDRLLEAVAHLPVDEARPELLAAIQRSDADIRRVAWARLVENAVRARDAEALGGVLELMTRRLRNDRDPVRATALSALAGVPVPLLAGEASAACLDRIAMDAVEARDCSADTRWALERLVFKVLESRAACSVLLDWALRTLNELTVRTGHLAFGAHGGVLPRGREQRIFDVLRPWLDVRAAKGDHRPLLTLTTYLGDRCHGMPELQRMLDEARERCTDGVFPQLVRVWLADPATRGERVAALLEQEPSAVALAPVLDVLSAHRTDLLDSVLAARPPYGRFLREGSARPLPRFDLADRWMPRQQEEAAWLAEVAVGDDSRAVYERAAVLRGAARIPGHGLELVRRHARSADTLLAETALAASARTVEPAAMLPELLAHAGDDHARVAVYAAGRAAAGTSPTRLAELLDGLLGASSGVKVTSRKEAARLTVRFLPARRAAALLARIAGDEDGHPDVVTAAVGLAIGLLETGEVWNLLETAAASGTREAGAAIAHTSPLWVARPHRPRYARLVALVAASPHRSVAGQAVAALPDWVAFAPEAADPVRLAVCGLSPDPGWKAAAAALGKIAGSGLPHPVGGGEPGSQFHRAVAELLAVVRSGDDPEAEAERDLPALQRVRFLSQGIDGEHHELRAALVRQLAGEPALATTRVALLRRSVDLCADLPELRAALDTLVAAHEGRPGLAASTASALRDGGRHGGRVPDPAVVLEAARGLAENGARVPGMFAVALTTAMGRRFGWPPQWRALLRELRRHAEPEVQDAALGAVTHDE